MCATLLACWTQNLLFHLMMSLPCCFICRKGTPTLFQLILLFFLRGREWLYNVSYRNPPNQLLIIKQPSDVLFWISCTFVLCHVIFIFYKSFLQDLFASLVFCIYLSWLRSIDQMHSVLSPCSWSNLVRISCDFCLIIVKFVLEIWSIVNQQFFLQYWSCLGFVHIWNGWSRFVAFNQEFVT